MRVLGGRLAAGFVPLLLLAAVAQAQLVRDEPVPTVPKFVALGGRVARMSEADTTLFELAYVGKIEEACNHFAAHWKDLESCIGLRALQDAPRRELLAGLAKRGFVDYRREWDRTEILLVDPLGHFAGLLPDLKLEELGHAPGDQIIALFQHPDFPKAWLKDEACAWMALRALKAHDESRDALRDILQCGISAERILMTQADDCEPSSDAMALWAIFNHQRPMSRTLRHLLEEGYLKLQDPSEKKVVLNIALQAEDPDLWRAMAQRRFKWSIEFDDNGHLRSPLPRKLEDFADWANLQRYLGVDLHQPGLLDRILGRPVAEKDVKAAQQYLKEVRPPTHNARAFGILRDCHISWLPLLMHEGLYAKTRGQDDGTLLHVTSGCDRLKILLDAGVDPRVRNRQGDTCLFSPRSPDELDLLIQAGAPADALNELGENALFYQSDADSLARLRQAGADPRIVNQRGETIWDRLDFEKAGRSSGLILVTDLSPIDGTLMDEPLASMVDVLLEEKGTRDLANKDGLRPVMLMAGKGRPVLLWKVLNAGALKLAMAPDGCNALDRALLLAKGDAWKCGPARPWDDEDGHALPRMALCLWLLKEAGVRPHVTAETPGLDPEVWPLWLKLKDESRLPDELLSTALNYDEPELCRKWVASTPEGLARLIEACAWRSAAACLDAQPDIAREHPQVIQDSLAIMREKRQCNFTGSCAIQAGYRQESFDAFLVKLEAMGK